MAITSGTFNKPQTSQTEGRSDTGTQFTDKAKEAGTAAMDKARDIAGTATDKAKDVAANVGKKAEDATHAVGHGMQSLAGTVRENLPREGAIGTAASTVAGCLENTGKYLEKEGIQGMAEDVTNLIRRNPLPAVLVGIGLGFLLARVTMPSRS
jgi:hypothetical protein